ncbi:peptidoglycan-associated lipoprotein [Prosthecochloris sp. GSB1]|uniref:peptidoglycan-associated lipoprotein Pal n=1 Tax=Prosthecochloris sp. GSB1 TaxID=281093 RepID=UPI000B8C7DCE|nr:peptidoglycan-associated lipoprotein Pal [Prosthecochloris sp. GSB1]ASQ90807.1 peptidoglycan-associated lipoprotein [Prosthecochloris sp. GSB1]
MKKLLAVCSIVAAVAVTGCSSKSTETAVVDSASDYGSAAGATLMEQARSAGFDDVFFEFDSSVLDARANEQLKTNAKWLIEHPDVSCMIEGHCDERGTAEYNIALGERRAEVSKSFLANAGVAASRMETVSYGEERPFDPGHSEAAWSQNRRAHFVFK